MGDAPMVIESADHVALAERLARVIGSVAHRDVKPENPEPAAEHPLWCAFETDPHSEHPFHGPRGTEAEAQARAEEMRADGCDATVRRCRQVRASEVLRHAVEYLVDHINDDPYDLAVDGAPCYGGWDSPIASVREGADLSALDGLIEIKRWLIEPEGATP
jgi:hypothetical protein